MTIHRYALQTGLMALMILAAAPLLHAQETPLTLSVKNPQRAVTVGRFTEFEITLSNNAPNDFNIRVIRIVDEMPDNNWYSSICSLVECYPKEVDTIPVQTVYGDGGSIITFVHVITEKAAGTGHVTLRFETVDGAYALTQDLEVTASFPGGVDRPEVVVDLPAYPNPASASAMIPLPATNVKGGPLHLDLYDARGAHVADFTDAARNAHDAGVGEVRVDVRAMPAGYYRYRLVLDGVVRSGALLITR